MAFLDVEKANYEVTEKTLLINYATDEVLTNVQLSRNGIEFIDAITFSQTSAMFDLTGWENGNYTDCVLRGHYEDMDIITNINRIVVNASESVDLELCLNENPGKSIVMTLSSENRNAASLSRSTLTFTEGNYNIPQSVTIIGSSVSVDSSTNILVSVENVVRKSIPVLVNAAQLRYSNIVTNTTAIQVNEGSYVTLSVRLDAAPPENQTVTIKTDNSNIMISRTSMTFTPSNYNTYQTVTITGMTDTDSRNDKESIVTLSSNNGEVTVYVLIKNVTPQ